MVKNLPANAQDTGSVPCPGRSHMLWRQLSLCVRTTEACMPRAHALQQEGPLQCEVCEAQLEKA